MNQPKHLFKQIKCLTSVVMFSLTLGVITNTSYAQTGEPVALNAESVSAGAFEPGAFSEPAIFTDQAFGPEAFAAQSFSEGAFVEGAFAAGAFSARAFGEKSFAENAISGGAIGEKAIAPGAISEGAWPELTDQYLKPMMDEYLEPMKNTTDELYETLQVWKKERKKARWKKWAKILAWTSAVFAGTGDLIAQVIFIKQSSNSSSSSAAQNTHHEHGADETKEQSPKSQNETYGNKSQFASMVDAYKQPNKVCTKNGSGGNKTCYSTVNAGTMKNHNKFKNKAHKKAAKQYGQYATGGASGVPEPNEDWKNSPSSVKYHAYYKNQTAMGSHSTNHMAENIGNRTTFTDKNGNKSSQMSQFEESQRKQPNSAAAKMAQQVPVFSTLYSIHSNIQKIPSGLHSVNKKVQNVSSGMSSANSQMGMANQKAYGNQLHKDAKNQAQGEPHKVHPHE